jgi:hypothetical protein
MLYVKTRHVPCFPSLSLSPDPFTTTQSSLAGVPRTTRPAGSATTLPSLSGGNPPSCQSSRRAPARAPTMTYAFPRRRRKHHNAHQRYLLSIMYVRTYATQVAWRDGQRDSADTPHALSTLDASPPPSRSPRGQSERPRAAGLEWPSRRPHQQQQRAEHVGGRPGGHRPTRTEYVSLSPRAIQPPTHAPFCPAGSSSSPPAFLVSTLGAGTDQTPRRDSAKRPAARHD